MLWDWKAFMTKELISFMIFMEYFVNFHPLSLEPPFHFLIVWINQKDSEIFQIQKGRNEWLVFRVNELKSVYFSIKEQNLEIFV